MTLRPQARRRHPQVRRRHPEDQSDHHHHSNHQSYHRHHPEGPSDHHHHHDHHHDHHPEDQTGMYCSPEDKGRLYSVLWQNEWYKICTSVPKIQAFMN